MKPDWDPLAAECSGSSTVIIADVDCTADGQPLCEKYGVKGYPTIKSFSPPDTAGEDYEGGRDLDSLRKFAESLGPSCSIDNKDLCSAEDLETIIKYAAMSEARRSAKIVKLQNAITKETARHEGVGKEMQARYEASETALKTLQDELKPKIKLLVAATPQAG
jgi:protein disulfide-isomerase A6